MSEQDSSDKTEEPTAKRLREAREKGQVPRSRDLSAAAIVLAAGITLVFGAEAIGEGAMQWMHSQLSIDAADLADPGTMFGAFTSSYRSAIGVMMPLVIAALVAAIAAPMLIGGWNISGKAIAPDFKKLDPVKGLGKVFSANGLVELVKALLKFAVVGFIAVNVLLAFAPELMGLSREAGRIGILHGFHLVGWAFIWVSSGLLVIAAIDAPFQLWNHTRQLKMSHKEIKDEMKESEGNPELKSKQRQQQEQAARGRMMQDVPDATVVVTNPTHFAVALKYVEGKTRAPIVVAKGGDLIAAEIRELARSNRVPLLEVPMLARALYHGSEIGHEIPAVLYQAVAQVLTYVMQLKRFRPGNPFPELGEVQVPEQLARPLHERLQNDEE